MTNRPHHPDCFCYACEEWDRTTARAAKEQAEARAAKEHTFINMLKKKLIIIRGVSGSGKSTVAKLFGEDAVICTADDFFYDSDGNYNFNANHLSIAHEQCFRKFLRALNNPDVDTIVIANTNTQQKEFQKYIDEAEKHGSMVFSLVVERRHNGINSHGVPDYVIDRHEQNIINTLKLK